MNANSKILAVIPARGGSKGLPGKNIRPLQGIPLIAYSIAAALQSKLVNRVICTTDSEEIAETAREYGAETPFLRPLEFAQDHSTDFEVFVHLLDWLSENEGYRPDILVQLRPTSPIRPNGFVDEGLEKILNDPALESLRTVCPAPNTPYKMWTISDDQQRLVPLLSVEGVEEPYNAPRQILPEVWWQAGLLDIIRTETISEKNSMSGKNISYLKVNPEYAVDIDTKDDFLMAERMITKLDCIKP